jgi:hypothetical protein
MLAKTKSWGVSRAPVSAENALGREMGQNDEIQNRHDRAGEAKPAAPRFKRRIFVPAGR